jgi:lipopolysaccharide biosynthesis protein
MNDDSSDVRAVAFYLPQFHPIPQNDAWWGPGFTEWTNVVAARPLFRGHVQPHLPADLGFYDLRVPEVRQAQAELARSYGVTAFCYWHYWFAGERLLQRPFAEVLASGSPDFPFCLGWANQTWSGVWHGAADKVLMEQTYPGPQDDEAHFASLLPAFTDARYLRVGGRPLFYVFRPEQLPDPQAWVSRWQDMARANGLPGLYLVAELSDLLGNGPAYSDIREHGWDAGVYVRLPADTSPSAMFRMRMRRKFRGGPEVYPYARVPIPIPEALRDSCHPCVYPNWDHTPRTGRAGVVLHGATPERFLEHARAAVATARNRHGDEKLLFIKSWNEWAEGNYLEPDLEFGQRWLAAVREATQPRHAP